MPSTRILPTSKNPFCSYEKGHCPKRGKAVVGRELPWASGHGSQQNVWCAKCPASGVISRNFTHQKKVAGIVVPDARVPMEKRWRT